MPGPGCFCHHGPSGIKASLPHVSLFSWRCPISQLWGLTFPFAVPLVIHSDTCLEEEDENSDRGTARKARPEVITFTDEETAQLARIQPQESATVSEQVLVQSAAEKDRISEMKDRQAELEAEPKYANCCSYCPKSFKKPSDLVR